MVESHHAQPSPIWSRRSSARCRFDLAYFLDLKIEQIIVRAMFDNHAAARSCCGWIRFRLLASSRSQTPPDQTLA